VTDDDLVQWEIEFETRRGLWDNPSRLSSLCPVFLTNASEKQNRYAMKNYTAQLFRGKSFENFKIYSQNLRSFGRRWSQVAVKQIFLVIQNSDWWILSSVSKTSELFTDIRQSLPFSTRTRSNGSEIRNASSENYVLKRNVGFIK